MYEGLRLELTFSGQSTAVNRVIPQRSDDIVVRVIKLNRANKSLRYLADFAVVNATASHVPDIEQQKPVRLIRAFDDGATILYCPHIPERHDLKNDCRAVLGSVATKIGESRLHARNVGDKFLWARITYILSQARSNLDVSSTEGFSYCKQLTADLI